MFSPWILVALIVCVVPAFMGETHFAFLGYSLNVPADHGAPPDGVSAASWAAAAKARKN